LTSALSSCRTQSTTWKMTVFSSPIATNDATECRSTSSGIEFATCHRRRIRSQVLLYGPKAIPVVHPLFTTETPLPLFRIARVRN
jgi:hypothetical protein